MSDATEQIRRVLLALPTEERPRVLAEVVASLDDGPDAEDEAWVGEMRRRADRAINGESQGVPLSEVRARAMKALKKK